MHRVNINSPGIWEFLGKLNPLEVVRQYLCDLHERKKDRQYRNVLERDRLALENASLRLTIVKDALTIARVNDINPDDAREIIDRLVLQPLASLDNYPASGIAYDAKTRAVKKEDARVWIQRSNRQ